MHAFLTHTHSQSSPPQPGSKHHCHLCFQRNRAGQGSLCQCARGGSVDAESLHSRPTLSTTLPRGPLEADTGLCTLPEWHGARYIGATLATGVEWRKGGMQDKEWEACQSSCSEPKAEPPQKTPEDRTDAHRSATTSVRCITQHITYPQVVKVGGHRLPC